MYDRNYTHLDAAEFEYELDRGHMLMPTNASELSAIACQSGWNFELKDEDATSVVVDVSWPLS